MVAEITAALAGIKGLLDIVKDLSTLRTEEEVKTVRAALNGEILKVQNTALDLVAAREADRERIAELESEIERIRDWSEVKERYALAELVPGSFAYVETPSDDEELRAPPYFCTNCFEDERLSVLQIGGVRHGHSVHTCPRCNNQVLA